MNKILPPLYTLSLAALLSGCSSFSEEMYQYSAQPGDPIIEFSSDYEYFTKFHINADTPISARQCKNTQEIGTLLYTDSIFIFAKPNRELKTVVPADKEILIRGYTYREGFSCGPLNRVFTPEKGKTYHIRYVKSGKYCQMNITEKGNEAVEVKVSAVSNKCLK
jgi:hypothetical protein